MPWISFFLIAFLSFMNINDEEIAWIRSHAVPIKTVTPGNGFDDLQKIKAAVGDARIVAVGEATHGTREFFQMKHRLTEFLATEMHFTMFAIEANMPEAYAVNDYVLTGRGDPRQSLGGMYFWTWNTQEVLDMIEWMRAFNASGKGTIQFVGFDMQTPKVALNIVRRFVTRVDPSYASLLDSVSVELDSIKAAGTEKRPSRSFEERALRCSGAIAGHLVQTRPVYEKSERSDTVVWAIQNARIVAQAFLLMSHYTDALGMRIRDSCMAANISWILDRAPAGTRMVIWAHNGHVTKRRGLMGSFLADRYGTSYLSIAQTCYSGLYTARVRPTMEVRSDNVIHPPKEESLEAYCHSTGMPMFFLDARSASLTDPRSAWLTQPVRMRSIGALAMEEQQFVANISKEFDGFIYLENTTASACFGVPGSK